MSESSKVFAEQIKDALLSPIKTMEHAVSFTRRHVNDPVLVSKLESNIKGIKDTIQYIDDKLKG